MLKQSKNVSKNLPKTIFTQGTQKTLLSPDFQRQKEDLAACCLKILFFQTVQSFCAFRSRGIAYFLFFREFPVAISCMDLTKIFDKTQGVEHNSILLNFGKLCQHVFFFHFKP